MKFEWNDEKRRQNISKHGMDLIYAALIFEGPTLTKIYDRLEYGEERLISLGLVNGTAFVVVQTQRRGHIRLSSAWKGGRKDYEKYQKSFP